MTKDYQQITQSVSTALAKLRRLSPGVMQGFSQMAQSATEDGALDKKTKELVALALGVAAHCDACIGFHTKALAKLGASTEEVVETLNMAIYMGGGPSLMYAAEALSAFDAFNKD
jgi:AhpD family alkylhydroperoxidase